MDAKTQLVHDVFKTTGQPTITYVHRSGGEHEKGINDALNAQGRICLITGPSKTGKTTLYTKVIESRGTTPIIIRCNSSFSSTDFWRQALEKLAYTRTKEVTKTNEKTITTKAEVEAGGGWKWLATIVGKVGFDHTKSNSEAECKERILADPAAHHIIPVLKSTGYQLIVEDFHYLSPEVQKIIFQDWKIFIDEEVSVILLSTSHHAADLAYANRDLIGRVKYVDVTTWTYDDLIQIPHKGFAQLGVAVDKRAIETLVIESVGLPIVTQAACRQLVLSSGYTTRTYLKNI